MNAKTLMIILPCLGLLFSCANLPSRQPRTGGCGQFYYSELVHEKSAEQAFLLIDLQHFTFKSDSIIRINSPSKRVRIEAFNEKGHFPNYCSDIKKIGGKINKQTLYCREAIIKVSAVKDTIRFNISDAVFADSLRSREIRVKREYFKAKMEEPAG